MNLLTQWIRNSLYFLPVILVFLFICSKSQFEHNFRNHATIENIKASLFSFLIYFYSVASLSFNEWVMGNASMSTVNFLAELTNIEVLWIICDYWVTRKCALNKFLMQANKEILLILSLWELNKIEKLFWFSFFTYRLHQKGLNWS